MKAVILAVSTGLVVAVSSVVPASALPGIPTATGADQSMIVPVSGGCGPRGFRDRFGRCVYPRRYRY